MFCYQCEQTTRGVGCKIVGKCGKTPETAELQDALIFAARRLAASVVAIPAADRDAAVAPLLEDALFTTVTNVNFDPDKVLVGHPPRRRRDRPGGRDRRRRQSRGHPRLGRRLGHRGAPGGARRGRRRPAGIADLRTEGNGRLRASRAPDGPRRPAGRRFRRRGARRGRSRPRRHRPALGAQPQVRRGLGRHARAARRGPHRHLRQADPDPGADGAHAGQGHSGFRPRSRRSARRCSNRPTARASTSTPTARCCLPTAIPN